jgi:hypothetical protein
MGKAVAIQEFAVTLHQVERVKLDEVWLRQETMPNKTTFCNADQRKIMIQPALVELNVVLVTSSLI